MPRIADIWRSIYGAYRLARMDIGGYQFFNLSWEGFWQSFFAFVIVAPLELLLMLARAASADQPQISLGGLVLELVFMVLTWSAFVVAMIFVSRLLDVGHNYVRFIIAYNWSHVVLAGVFVPLLLITSSGVLPDGLSAIIALTAVLASIAYLWFIAFTALELPWHTAAAIAALDLAVSLVIIVSLDRAVA